jgi:ribokinase
MSEFTPQIVVVGSHAPGITVQVKRIPVAGETVVGWKLEEAIDGGKGSNQAIAAARLGAPTGFVGCIGKDRLGAECERMLKAEGVEISHLYKSDSEGTGAGIIILDEHGIPAMVTSLGANEDLTGRQVESALAAYRGAEVMLTQFEIPAEVALHAARAAHHSHMISIVNPAPAAHVDLRDLAVADFLVPNQVETQLLLDFEPERRVDLEIAAQELRSLTGVGVVIITAGEQGIIGADSEGVWRGLPPGVVVVDTSGAGDVFCAALAVGLTRGMHHRAASAFASSAAALSVTKAGTIPSFPTLVELEEFNLSWGMPTA